MERDVYAQTFWRARHEAALRLNRPEYEDRNEAAAAIGISASMLKKIETGEKRPGWETLEQMARAYNVLPGDLLPSLAPKGPEVDKIMGPLMMISEPTRSLFINQMEALARALAAGMANAVLSLETQAIRDGNNIRNVLLSDTPSSTQKDAGRTLGRGADTASTRSNDGGQPEVPAGGHVDIGPHTPIYRRADQPGVHQVRSDTGGTPERPKRRGRGAK